MKTAQPATDPAFLEKQRRELLRLRSALVAASEQAQTEESEIKTQRANDVLEREEDAQGLDALERGENLVSRSAARLERVNRALQKIEEGTYGLSDKSGSPIPRQRLEASPEAIYTVTEEESLEGKSR